jgi:hypothetical protein
MNLSDFVTSSGKRICKDHFINLVQVARSDGKISNEQMTILHKEGRKFGLTDPEIDKFIESEAEYSYTPPYSLRGKFVHLYNIADIILDDEIVAEGERKIIRKFAIEAGFSDHVIDGLLEMLFEGIAKGEPEEKLFKEFKKKYF